MAFGWILAIIGLLIPSGIKSGNGFYILYLRFDKALSTELIEIKTCHFVIY